MAAPAIAPGRSVRIRHVWRRIGWVEGGAVPRLDLPLSFVKFGEGADLVFLFFFGSVIQVRNISLGPFFVFAHIDPQVWPVDVLFLGHDCRPAFWTELLDDASAFDRSRQERHFNRTLWAMTSFPNLYSLSVPSPLSTTKVSSDEGRVQR